MDWLTTKCFTAAKEKENNKKNSFCPKRMLTSGSESCWCRSVMSDSLRPQGLERARLLCPWDSPGKNTEAGFHTLLQGIFLTQGLNLGLLYCRRILYHLSPDQGPNLSLLHWEHRLSHWTTRKVQTANSFKARSAAPAGDGILWALESPVPSFPMQGI